MLLVIRIVTIIVSLACIAVAVFLIVFGLLEKPSDADAVWIGIGLLLYYAANLYLLHRSHRKKHNPTHWVALMLSLLPPLIILIITWVADKAG
jgi:hypothetical protein